MKINNKLKTSSILNRESSYAVEQSSSNSFKLMINAGKKTAKEIQSNYKKTKTLILCGIGGNGGDGFITAQELLNKGWDIEVAIIGNKNKIKDDSLKALKKLKINTHDFKDIQLEKIGLFVDAIIGIGLSRNIKDNISKVLKIIDNHNSPIVALDIPSGIDCNSGKILGYAAHCELVITFSSLKYGHILTPGSEKSKNIKVINIGISRSVLNDISPSINLNIKKYWINNIKWPKIDDHKYSRGFSLVVGGPKNMTGAARLAAISAQRTGSGIVCVAVEKNAEQIYFITLLSQIVKTYRNIEEFTSIINEKRINSIVIGPGLKENNSSILKVKSTLKTNKKILLDAGAISCFKGKLKIFKNIIADKDVIITPHEGELNAIMPEISGNIIDKALNAAEQLGCIVVLKGATTVIASPNNKALVNCAGSKWLSTAGSGDVLAGIIGGLLSNKMDSYLAAAFGVWLHSEIGNYLGPGLIAEDIPIYIKKILKKLL